MGPRGRVRAGREPEPECKQHKEGGSATAAQRVKSLGCLWHC